MKRLLYIIILSITFLLAILFVSNCNNQKKEQKYSVRMARSTISRNPQAWMLDFSKQPKWGYCHGVVGKAMLDLWEVYDMDEFYKYIVVFTDSMVDKDGAILGYNLKDYNIDRLNSGKLLFRISQREQNDKYIKAIYRLRNQLNSHPRTKEGGFWHKKVYPHQIWLDGLYMGTPFYAQYCKEFDEYEGFKDIANQIFLVREHLYDPQTGLYKHGWDESHSQEWSDSITGQSSNIWGRGVGWFAMAIVDVLDFFPKDHPDYTKIVSILTELFPAIIKYQDEKTGVWHQVMDLPMEKGNYLESTASTMFTYVLLKSLRKGYLDNSFQTPAIKAYEGILKQFIKEEKDGTLSITNCCAGAGLGGNPYRDGSYEYYINEHVRNNDPKAVGPFIMASIEYELMFP